MHSHDAGRLCRSQPRLRFRRSAWRLSLAALALRRVGRYHEHLLLWRLTGDHQNLLLRWVLRADAQSDITCRASSRFPALSASCRADWQRFELISDPTRCWSTRWLSSRYSSSSLMPNTRLNPHRASRAAKEISLCRQAPGNCSLRISHSPPTPPQAGLLDPPPFGGRQRNAGYQPNIAPSRLPMAKPA